MNMQVKQYVTSMQNREKELQTSETNTFYLSEMEMKRQKQVKLTQTTNITDKTERTITVENEPSWAMKNSRRHFMYTKTEVMTHQYKLKTSNKKQDKTDETWKANNDKKVQKTCHIAVKVKRLTFYLNVSNFYNLETGYAC